MNFERKYKIQKACKILGLLILYVGYLLAGGYLIEHIEGENDLSVRREVRDKLFATLSKHDLSPNDTLVQDIVSIAIEAYEHGIDMGGSYDANITSIWNWCTGVFFCNTLLTTVGYGNMHPRTFHGKIFCILYPVVGIIIIAMLLTNAGSAFAKFIEGCDTFWTSVFDAKAKKRKKTKTDVKVSILITQLFITVLLSIVFICIIPALALNIVEGWSFVTSLYVCMMTLTTIGLGDITPWHDVDEETATTYQIVQIVYILIGLITLSTILHLLNYVLRDSAINQAQDILYETKKMIVENTHKVENMLLQTKDKIKNSSDIVENMLKQTKANIQDNSHIVEDMLLQTSERVRDSNSAVADLLKQTKAKIKDNDTMLEDMLQETKDRMKDSNIMVESMLVDTNNKICLNSLRRTAKKSQDDDTSTISGLRMKQSDRIKAASKLIRGGSNCIGSKMRRSLQRIKQPNSYQRSNVLPTSNQGSNPNVFIKIVAEKSSVGLGKKETIYDD